MGSFPDRAAPSVPIDQAAIRCSWELMVGLFTKQLKQLAGNEILAYTVLVK